MSRLNTFEKQTLFKLAKHNKSQRKWSDWLAIRKLREQHLVTIDPQGNCTVTPKAKFLIETGFI